MIFIGSTQYTQSLHYLLIIALLIGFLIYCHLIIPNECYVQIFVVTISLLQHRTQKHGPFMLQSISIEGMEYFLLGFLYTDIGYTNVIQYIQ